MKNWEKFEVNCTDYLNDKFSDYARFEHQGGSDSTTADIKIKTINGQVFYIEAKETPAQCGQFVLLPDIQNQEFTYSDKNISSINVYSREIMRHMNRHFEEFKEAGTSGKDIVMENGEDIFADWIIQYYKDKGVRYFITNNFVILPIDHFRSYFNITAKYRIKRSGSSSPGRALTVYFSRAFQNGEYDEFCITDVFVEGTKLFVKSNTEIHNKRFYHLNYEYMFSKRDDRYELRKLSNTFNANVIFSITAKGYLPGLTDDEFISSINSGF